MKKKRRPKYKAKWWVVLQEKPHIPIFEQSKEQAQFHIDHYNRWGQIIRVEVKEI